jgi:hypothetical protein
MLPVKDPQTHPHNPIPPPKPLPIFGISSLFTSGDMLPHNVKRTL